MLVVGISAYPQGSGLSSSKYAARDAEVLGATLKSQGYLVRQLTESDATRAMIRRSLRGLSDAVSPNEGTILFFFGGHGFTFKGLNYLATFGVIADDLDGEGLAVKDVEELLRASKAKRKLLFVDACRNDPGQAARSAEQRSFAKLQASEGMRVLFSTKEGRVSFEDDALRQGVFTYFLAKGLQGEAAGAGTPPKIYVSAQQKDQEWIFSVRDNGMGIEEENLAKIFAPFKRLHGREIPGSGIGLAICQKIVEHYRGPDLSRIGI